MTKRRTPHRGFLAIDAAIGVAIIGLVVVATTGAAVGYRKLSASNRTRAAREAQRAAAQDAAATGFAPDRMTNNPLQAVQSQVIATNTDAATVNRIGAVKLAGITANLDDGVNAGSARAAAMGLQIRTDADAIPVTVTALAAPTITIANGAVPTFPMSNFVALPANPPWTAYRFTVDGTSPSANSAAWTPVISYSMLTYPRTFKIQAYNPDPRYSPSTITTATFGYPAAGYAFSRQGGGASVAFGIMEVINAANGGVSTFNGTAYTATVKFNTTGRTIATTTGAGWWPQVNDLPGGTCGITVTMTPQNPNFAASDVVTNTATTLTIAPYTVSPTAGTP